jgi:hypothetical protein
MGGFAPGHLSRYKSSIRNPGNKECRKKSYYRKFLVSSIPGFLINN